MTEKSKKPVGRPRKVGSTTIPDDTKRFTVELEPDLRTFVNIVADFNNTSSGEIVRLCLIELLIDAPKRHQREKHLLNEIGDLVSNALNAMSDIDDIERELTRLAFPRPHQIEERLHFLNLSLHGIQSLIASLNVKLQQLTYEPIRVPDPPQPKLPEDMKSFLDALPIQLNTPKPKTGDE